MQIVTSIGPSSAKSGTQAGRQFVRGAASHTSVVGNGVAARRRSSLGANDIHVSDAESRTRADSAGHRLTTRESRVSTASKADRVAATRVFEGSAPLEYS